MTEEERDEMMHRNWVAQMNGLGFDESGYMLDLQHPIRLVEEPKWISVDEKLPEEGVLVLISFFVDFGFGTKTRAVDTALVEESTFLGGGLNNYLDGPCKTDVTHWMPLPKPPEEGK